MGTDSTRRMFWRLAALSSSGLLRAADLVYRDRGNRSEGIRPKPVGGAEVELISAMVDLDEDPQVLPEVLRIRFFLPSLSQPFVTIRELNYRHFYWMDHLRPSSPWRPGFTNMFEWPTADVLQHLSPFSITDLGMLARLNSETALPEERIAPIALSVNSGIITVRRYVFSFRPGALASIQASLHKEGASKATATFQVPVARGGRAFGITWQVEQAPAGLYRLIVNGTNTSDNRTWAQHVIFHHESRL